MAITKVNNDLLTLDAAQPTITSVGTLTGFTSTGIDDNATSNTITIDASENVGIGTSNPSDYYAENLVVAAADEGGITIECGATEKTYLMFAQGTSGQSAYRGFIGYDHNTSLEIMNVASSGTLNFITGSGQTERMRIDASGRVLVNTQSNIGGARFNVEHPTDCIGCNIGPSASGTRYFMYFTYNGTNVGSIQGGSTSTSFTTSSDYRLKENVVPMTGSIDRVKALKPSRFNFIVDADTTVDGFLAHEAQTVVPECVTGTKDAMRDEEYEVTAAVEEVRDEDDNVTTEAAEAVMGTRSVPDMQGIDQSKLVPLLVAALQEAIARIETLEGA